MDTPFQGVDDVTSRLHFPSSTIFDIQGQDSFAFLLDPTSGTSNGQSLGGIATRVCDRCIRKKVKCDLNRPVCSRCREGNWPCIYSAARRKPGPSRGSRRKVQAQTVSVPTPPPSNTQLSVRNFETDLLTTVTREEENNASSHDVDILDDFDPQAESTDLQFNYNFGTHDELSPIDLQLDNEEERQLLDSFFSSIHPSLSLFTKDDFFKRYANGSLDRELLVTILAISAKFLNTNSLPQKPDFDSIMEKLLARNIFDYEGSENLASLDMFKQAALISFYEFHHKPSPRAWMRTGQLTRKAYERGLHQIDNRDQCPLYDQDRSEDEIKDWRRVWWYIYCLDSYSNITAAVPFIIELDSIQTALTGSSTESSGSNDSLIFLSTETDQLWKTVKGVVIRGADVNPSMHIITSTVLREAAQLHRLRSQTLSERIFTRVAVLKQSISSIRLALPENYLNSMRNIGINESKLEHQARLICILHLRVAQLLTSLPPFPENSETEWSFNWQSSIEYCQEIVSVIAQWDDSFCFNVDPAVCFIIAVVLLILYVHSRCGMSADPDMQDLITTKITKLRQFLERFSNLWNLPKMVLDRCDNFIQMYPGPLTRKEAEHVIRQIRAPLRPGTSNYLAKSSPAETQANNGARPTESNHDSSMNEGWEFDLMWNDVVTS